MNLNVCRSNPILSAKFLKKKTYLCIENFKIGKEEIYKLELK